MEMPHPEWTHAVAAAFRESGSTLALSRSPLAVGPLIAAGLVLDDVAPTADERGLALRLALQWATEQLAPKAARYGFGVERPPAESSWRDPRWWRYTLLRHRWLEPLPAEECAAQGGSVAALQARTGIGTPVQLLDEQAHALHAAAGWLLRQQNEGIANDRLRELAIAAVLFPLRDERTAVELLTMASLFGGVFERAALLELTQAEGLDDASCDAALELLARRRCLQVGDGGARLWMSPTLRVYVLEYQPKAQLSRRALAAAECAEHAARAGNSTRAVDAVLLSLLGGQPRRAAELFLALGTEARAELARKQESEAQPLLDGLLQPQVQRSLSPQQARALFLLRADERRSQGRSDEAIADCREALHHATTAVEQALVYGRLASLFSEQNEQQALTCYQLALERLPADHAETPILLKDRAWLHLARSEWRAAHDDLQRALDWQAAGAPAAPADEAAAVRADILDAMSHLQRVQGHLDEALAAAHAALALREQAGDPLRVARCYNNLGILYRTSGAFAQAIGAYRQAQAIFARVAQPALELAALLNVGAVHVLAGQAQEAESTYLQALALAEARELPLAAVRARAGLVELLADQGRDAELVQHWRAAFATASEWGFDDEVDYLRRLARRAPALAPLVEEEATDGAEIHGPEGGAGWPAGAALDAIEAAALATALRDGRVTVASLMLARPVSKATATRKLGRMAAAGMLQRHGSGRGTYYLAGAPATAPKAATPANAAELQARLDALTPRFSTSHTVERMEVGAAQTALDVHVSFRRLPDLDAFLALQTALGDATRTRVVLRMEG